MRSVGTRSIEAARRHAPRCATSEEVIDEADSREPSGTHTVGRCQRCVAQPQRCVQDQRPGLGQRQRCSFSLDTHRRENAEVLAHATDLQLHAEPIQAGILCKPLYKPFVSDSGRTRLEEEPYKNMGREIAFSDPRLLVAGAGFEPATFGL